MRIIFPPLFKQFFKFCRVGTINTIVSLVVIFVLSELMDIHYVLANVSGYLVGIILGFALHKSMTFQNTSKHTKTQFMQFLIVFLVTYILQLIALVFFVHVLHILNFISQILAIGIYTCLNFLGNRFFTFKTSQDKKTS